VCFYKLIVEDKEVIDDTATPTPSNLARVKKKYQASWKKLNLWNQYRQGLENWSCYAQLIPFNKFVLPKRYFKQILRLSFFYEQIAGDGVGYFSTVDPVVWPYVHNWVFVKFDNTIHDCLFSINM